MTGAYSNEKALWHLDKIATMRSGNQIVPAQIQLILSDLCNQDCHFCSYRMSGGISTEQFAGPDGNKNPNRKIELNKALEILTDAAGLGVKAIQFTGGGEPTVHPDHLKIFRHCLDLGMQAALVTNGVLLRDGWKNVLPEFSWIRVSVDAGGYESYSKIRNVSKGTYARVMRHIYMLADEIRDAESNCYLGVGFVITPENYREIERATMRIKDTGAAYVRLSAMFSENLTDPYVEIARDIRDRIRAAKDFETDSFKVIDLFGDRMDDLIQAAPDYDFCGYQQFNMYIGGNLKIYRCCSTSYTKHGEVGDLTNQTFSEWFASKDKRLAYAGFNARSCSLCQFNTKNRAIIAATGREPMHVNFV